MKLHRLTSDIKDHYKLFELLEGHEVQGFKFLEKHEHGIRWYKFVNDKKVVVTISIDRHKVKLGYEYSLSASCKPFDAQSSDYLEVTIASVLKFTSEYISFIEGQIRQDNEILEAV